MTTALKTQGRRPNCRSQNTGKLMLGGCGTSLVILAFSLRRYRQEIQPGAGGLNTLIMLVRSGFESETLPPRIMWKSDQRGYAVSALGFHNPCYTCQHAYTYACTHKKKTCKLNIFKSVFSVR